MKKLLAFALAWFLFVTWGIELGTAWAFIKATGTWPTDSPVLRFALIWTITLLRLTAVFLLLRWLGLRFGELFTGRFGMREFIISVLIVLAFIGLEVAYSGSYTLQSLQEFRYFLEISHSSFPLALLLFASQYAYYFVEIAAVNLLYLGGLRLSGKKAGIALPVFLWGFAHSINALLLHSVQGLLLGLYAGLLAFAMYYAALRRDSLKLPVFTWFLNLIL
ncbi:hypothetical protein [Thermococcus sp. 21S7]|uniref:hypothetical protein n=1 Tax=Thermococcus sp. 21S7 TaxID=1638221 RepID=UPI001439AFCD|nr:hypothetical protein [Thermococcus sp. 21S7]NJE60291.1 hypothetical protein [Thermococcus sp. 21S7]